MPAEGAARFASNDLWGNEREQPRLTRPAYSDFRFPARRDWIELTVRVDHPSWTPGCLTVDVCKRPA